MTAPPTGRASQVGGREWTRRATANLMAAADQLRDREAREQLRRDMAAAGYPADDCIRDLAAGHPMQVVLRRYGYRPVAPIGQRHPGGRRLSNLVTSALRPPTVAEQLVAGFSHSRTHRKG